MQAKALEIRDEATFIACLAVNMQPENDAQRYLLMRCGYPCGERPNVVVTHMSADGMPASNDPHSWGGRTWSIAHRYIIKNWAELRDGDVVDVQFILGETATKKISERDGG